MVKALYKASQAGVKIDLIIRGACFLRPGIKGISENIRVISIIGRFLEHSRIYYFLNGGKEEVYIGSADLMTRNFSSRVEVVCPINNPNIKKYIQNNILEGMLKGNEGVWLLNADGSYEKIVPKKGQKIINPQSLFLEYYAAKNQMVG